MNATAALLFLLLVPCAAFPAPATAPEYLYTLTPIVAKGGGATRALAVNNDGLVVGEVEIGEGMVQAFVWSQTNGMQVLGTLGGLNSRALDINEHGMVVGESDTSNGMVRAFVWTESAGMRVLPVSTSTIHSTALAVNDRDQIVGSLEDPQGMHAALWENDTLTLLPQLPGPGHVQALDINRSGNVVGQIQTGAEEEFAGHAFYFPGATTASNLTNFRLISAIGGSAAVAVNDHDTTTGYTMLDSSRVRAFRHQPDTGFTLLEDHDAQYSSSRDVNEKGDIVGSSIPSYWSDELACAWMGGRWFDLNEITETGPDWWLVDATGINQRRDIVGYGLRAERHQAFLLTPVPDRDPSGWPVCALDIRDISEKDRRDRSFILSVDVRHDAPVRRVLFYENGAMIGAVEEPPYEWGWQGRPEGEIEFYAEIVEKTGRRIRSPRQHVPIAPP